MISERIGRKGTALRIFTVILVVMALCMLPLHAAPFQEGEKAEGKIILGLKPKGEFTVDSAKATWQEAMQKLQAGVEAAPKEKIGTHEVSKLEVILKGESGVLWENIQKTMFACIRQAVRRISLAHSSVNNGVEIEAWLPVVGVDFAPGAELQEVKVKLLWVKKDSKKETKDPADGRTMLKVKESFFESTPDESGKTRPDYEKLYKYVAEAKKNFKPTEAQKNLHVVIDAKGVVPFEQVMLALRACRRAGIANVMFAAPLAGELTDGDGDPRKDPALKKPKIEEEGVIEKPIEKLEEDHVEKEAPVEEPADKPLEGGDLGDTLGVGGGSKGAYGQRWGKGALAREGGSPGTEAAVAAALKWLYQHQDKDGKWDQDGFSAKCDPKEQTKCDKPGTGQFDVAVTGLALLAFMGNGHTPKLGKFKKTVKNGLDWLIKQQKEDGSIGKNKIEMWVYNHAIGTAALCEAYALTRNAILKTPAQKAVDYIIKAQNPNLGWKYNPADGRNDTSVTGWMVVALKAAKDAKLSVPKSAFDGAINWLDRATNTAGKCGYMRPGDNGSVNRGVNDGFAKLPTMTAVSVFSRILCGKSRQDMKIIKGIEILKQNLPEWNKPKNDKADMYYWYYGTLAMFQYGGENWRKWNPAMKKALLENQRAGGCADGSWDPVDKWGMVGGRVYSTAIGALTLEVYYRYARQKPEK